MNHVMGSRGIGGERMTECRMAQMGSSPTASDGSSQQTNLKILTKQPPSTQTPQFPETYDLFTHTHTHLQPQSAHNVQLPRSIEEHRHRKSAPPLQSEIAEMFRLFISAYGCELC